MPDSYLELAERILAGSDRPLAASEIIGEARKCGLLPRHLYGLRQDRTLQARLSEDIARFGERSRFFRTAPGRYFLRAFAATTASKVGEYYARPRRKELPHKDILTLNLDLDELLHDDPIVPFPTLVEHLRAGRYSYRSLSDILVDPNATAIHSFLVVHDELNILSFRCGRFFPRSDPLYGRRTIGLSAVVTEQQVDILYESLFGIIASAVDELCSGIGLPRALAERARYGGEILPRFGIKSVRTADAPPILHMVLSYRCPPNFMPTKAALSVNDLRWIDPYIPLNSLRDFDTTSRFLLSERYACEFVCRAQKGGAAS